MTATPWSALGAWFAVDLSVVFLLTYLSLRWMRVPPLVTWRWTFGAAAVALAGTVTVVAIPATRQSAVLWSVSLFVWFGWLLGFILDLARASARRAAGGPPGAPGDA
jgi:hypothetical protein